MTPAEIVSLSVQGIQAIISLAATLGQRDAVLAALDGVLAAARAQTDRDLDAKHAPTTPAQRLDPKER